MNGDFQATGLQQGRLDGHANLIRMRMAAGAHPYRCSLHRIFTDQETTPQIERLLDVMELRDGNRVMIRREQAEAKLTKLQAMRIFPQPMKEVVLSVRTSRIPDRSAVRVERFEPQVPESVGMVAARRMPAPLGLCAQGQCILLWKTLQTRDVGRKREFTISYGKRR